MTVRHDGGGGGGGLDVRMQPQAVRDVADRVSGAGDTMETAGSATPADADHGLAGALLATVLARYCETGARLVLEAETLSETLRACHDTTVATDAAAAERFLVSGSADG